MNWDINMTFSHLIRAFRYSAFGLVAAIICLLLNTQSAQAQSSGASTVTVNVQVNVPSVVKLTGTDNITTMQTLVLDSSNIGFDSNLNATGIASVTWRGNTNSNNGFKITVLRSALTGTAPTAMQASVFLSGEPTPGSDQTVTVASPYVSGVALTKVPDSLPDTFCSTSGPGSANFSVKLHLSAPSSAGTGSVNTLLTFVAATL
ncbi:MAG: hypothetical protein K2X81_09300 [Candidatus Obscuribacterales bacterium]|nr:hypothetical protein [Candidatus Obscuribacterales bacterium]